MRILNQKNYKLVNIDITIILEKPKLSHYKQKIKENIAGICGLPVDKVNVKAKTSETLGFVGRKEGIEAFCVCEVR